MLVIVLVVNFEEFYLKKSGNQTLAAPQMVLRGSVYLGTK